MKKSLLILALPLVQLVAANAFAAAHSAAPRIRGAGRHCQHFERGPAGE